MNIFDHLIPDAAIIGIGSLDYHFDDDRHNVMYSFDVHLPRYSITIKSERIPHDAAEIREAWKQRYRDVKEKVARLLNEPTENRKAHQNLVDQCVYTVVDNLNHLLADLQPVPTMAPVVNNRIKKVQTGIKQLKELALK